jgi:catechol 2,3-dioxygenase-like lactoylglutathione lyase family enzyme
VADDVKGTPPIDPGTTIGHVHLKVGDLDRALGFHCGVLGFELMERMGVDVAFISAGGRRASAATPGGARSLEGVGCGLPRDPHPRPARRSEMEPPCPRALSTRSQRRFQA